MPVLSVVCTWHLSLAAVEPRRCASAFSLLCLEPVVIYEDNQPTIRVANNESSIADAGRHIEVKNFKLGELVEDSTIVRQK